MQHPFLRSSALLFGSLLVAASLASTAAGQSLLYWDTPGLGSGGDGWWSTTDDTSAGFWRLNGVGDGLAWSNASPADIAVFDGTAGTVYLRKNITAHGVIFATSGYTIANGSAWNLTLTGPGGPIATNSGYQSIEVGISGSNGLTKTGSGIFQLNGVNAYTGNTKVERGALRLGGDGVISTPTNTFYIGTTNGEVGSFLSSGSISSSHTIIGNVAGSEGSVTVANGTWTNSGNIEVGASGSGSLTVTGGVVTAEGITVTGYASGSVGSLTLSGGTLSTRQVVELSGTGTVTFDGGTLQARINQSNFLSGYESGDVTINAGGATIDSNGFDIGISTELKGVGGLTKRGGGTLTLSGNNDYEGTTTVTAGTLLRGTSNALPDNTVYTVNGGTLDLNDFDLTASSFSGSGGQVDLGSANLVIDQTGSTAFAGAINGTGGVTIKRSDTLTLSGNNTYTGGTTVSDGDLVLGHATDTLADSGAVTILNGSLVLGVNSDTVGAFTLSNGGIYGSGGTLSASSYAFTDFANVTADLSGSGALTKTGAGDLTLLGENTYTGGTSVNEGRLILLTSNSSISHDAATMTIGTAQGDVGTVQVNGGTSIDTHSLLIGNSGTGSLSINGGTVESASAVLGYHATGNGSVTVSGTWTNAGALVVGRAGAGSLTVSGGVVTVEGLTRTGNFGGSTGAITLSGNSSHRGTLSTHQLVESGTGTVTFDGGILQARVNESDFISGYEYGDVTFNAGGAFIDSNGRTIGISTALSGTGGLTKLGSGTLTLSGSNSYTGGTTLTAGTLALGHATHALGSSGALTISGGTLALGANSATVGDVTVSSGSISGSGGALTASSYAFTDTGSVSAQLAGAGELTKTGAGTLTLSGSNTYTGGTTVSGGLINFASGDNFGPGNITLSGGGLQWASGSTHDISSRLNAGGAGGTTFDTHGNDVTLASAMSGAGALTKQGTGTLALSGSSTYSGNATVSEGALKVNTGGSLSNHVGYIGFESGDVASADVAGTWTNAARLYVGNSGTGALTIRDGGTVSNAEGFLGRNAGSSGSADVSGAWTNSSSLTVGSVGSGDLTIRHGGLVSNTSAYIGRDSGGSGSVDVAGTWTNSGHLHVGYSGDGALTIQDGGSVSSSAGTLGQFAGSSASVDVSGTWSITHADLVVGSSADATLTVKDGGQINAGNGSKRIELVQWSNNSLSGTLNITGSTTAGVLNVSSVYAGGGIGTLNFNHSDSDYHFTKDGTSSATPVSITGSTIVNHLGSGTTTFSSGENTYTGDTTISAGTLLFTRGTAFYGSSSVDATSAGKLSVGANGTASFALGTYNFRGGSLVFYFSPDDVTTLLTNGSWADGATIGFDTTNTNANFELTSVLADTNAGANALRVLKSGEGTLTISGTNTYSGGTTVESGFISFAHGDNLGTGAITLDGGGLSWKYGNSHDISNRLNPIGAAGATFESTWNSVTFATGMSGSGGITKLGNTRLTLSDTNTYTGGTTIFDGTLELGHATDTLSDSGAVTISGGTLNLGANSDTVGTVTLAHGSIIGSGGTLTASSYDFAHGTVSANLAGSGAMNKTSGGTVTLSGTNSYSGGTTINDGFISFTKGDNFGTGAITLDGGGITWKPYTPSIDISNRLNPLGAGGGTFKTSSSHGVILASVISGTGSVTIQGPNKLTLSGNNSYTGGTIIDGGTLAISADARLGGTGNLSFSGGTLQTTTTFSSDRDVALNAGGGTFNVGSSTTLTLNGDITGAAGNPLTKIGAGTLLLGGTNSYGGDTRVNVGTLRLGAAGALSPNTHLRVQPGAIFDPNGFAISLGRLEGDGNVNLGSADLSLNQADDTTFAGIIAGTGGLAKSGAGRLTLTGAHTFTGGTDVTSGELRLNGSAAHSAFNITGGRLSGSGTIGALTLGNAGTLAPGNSPGTLSAGDTTWSGGGTYVWEINDATGIVGTSWDLLDITGALTIDATSGNPFTIAITSLTAGNLAGDVPNWTPDANHSYSIAATTAGVLGFSADRFTLNTTGFSNPTNGTWSLGVNSNSLDLIYTTSVSAVPEPATSVALLGLIGFGFAATRRRPRPSVRVSKN